MLSRLVLKCAEALSRTGQPQPSVQRKRKHDDAGDAIGERDERLPAFQNAGQRASPIRRIRISSARRSRMRARMTVMTSAPKRRLAPIAATSSG